MKTTIGVLTEENSNEQVINIASEFFGDLKDGSLDDLDKGIIWITFRSGAYAKEFAQIINLRCVDKNQESFK